MNISLLLRGLVIGFSIAVPVGPIGILCIRRSLTQGWLVGLLTGLGAATADAIYGCVAGFGLTLISTVLINQAVGLRLVGGLFLCYLGIKTLMEPALEVDLSSRTTAQGLIKSYASTVFLTLTNPVTIFSFAAVFAGLGLASQQSNYASAGVLVSGVFLGSALWWVLLSLGVGLFRSHFNSRRLRWLNQISGLVLLVFGIIALSPV